MGSEDFGIFITESASVESLNTLIEILQDNDYDIRSNLSEGRLEVTE